jgi:CBS domain containing-hemolysin-like protein
MEEFSWGSILIRVAAVLFLVLANGFFVAAEFALVGIRRSRVAALVAEGRPKAHVLLRVVEQLDAYISATQLGITMASLALGWIGEDTLAHLFRPVFRVLLPAAPAAQSVAAHSVSVGVAFATITFLHIVLGELAPKTLALERTERVALRVARPMELFYRVFKAPIWLLNQSGGLVLKLMRLRSRAESAATYTEEELRQLIALSHKSGHLGEDERQLIYNIFDFTETSLEEVMVPRLEIEALDAELSFAEMLGRFESTGYSRMPVYRGSLENIIGIALYKDLCQLVRSGERAGIDAILRPPIFLPTSMKLNDALRSLRRSSVHMAIVVDEHGGVEGLVTLEDLLEQIVGEISDEHDEVALGQILEQPDGTLILSGGLSIREANRRLGLGLPESDSYKTIAGFMIARAGRLLGAGDSVEHDGLRLTVHAAARNRILQVKIQPVGARPEEPA